jgi:hypothetical protein
MRDGLGGHGADHRGRGLAGRRRPPAGKCSHRPTEQLTAHGWTVQARELVKN